MEVYATPVERSWATVTSNGSPYAGTVVLSVLSVYNVGYCDQTVGWIKDAT